jgi:hypothetical protein
MNKLKLTILFIISLPVVLLTQNWTQPINVSNMGGFNQMPDFCIDSNGVIHCVWTHFYNVNYSKIFYNKSLDDGLTWITAEDISLNSEKRIAYPHIACDSENNLHLTYDYDIGNYLATLVYYKKFDGSSWSDPLIISENMPESHANKLVIDHNDRVYCFWYRSINNGTTYYRYKENGVWSDIFLPYNNSDYFAFSNCAIEKNNNLHWIGAHYYDSQTAYEIRPIYFYYNYADNTWSNFIEFGTHRAWYGFDIDLDTLNLPHLVWQEFINENIPPNDGTFYSFFNGSDWAVPDLIVEDPMEQQIIIDENNNINIFDVEKNEEGSWLVHYYLFNGFWEGKIIDESEWYGMFPEVKNSNHKIYIIYYKSLDDTNSDIYFINADIISRLDLINHIQMKMRLIPNPFKKTVKILTECDQNKKIEVMIFSLRGELINQLSCRNTENIKKEFIWDGKDLSGKEVNSGLYLVRLISGRKVLTKSIEYMK